MRPYSGRRVRMRLYRGQRYRIYTNKAKRNLFACLSVMAGHALYGMAPCLGHTGVTFDDENDRPGPGSLRGHFDAARGCYCSEPLLEGGSYFVERAVHAALIRGRL